MTTWSHCLLSWQSTHIWRTNFHIVYCSDLITTPGSSLIPRKSDLFVGLLQFERHSNDSHHSPETVIESIQSTGLDRFSRKLSKIIDGKQSAHIAQPHGDLNNFTRSLEIAAHAGNSERQRVLMTMIDEKNARILLPLLLQSMADTELPRLRDQLVIFATDAGGMKHCYKVSFWLPKKEKTDRHTRHCLIHDIYGHGKHSFLVIWLYCH